MPLDVKTIDAAKLRAAPYRLSDGGGLLLEIKPSGAKIWLCRLTVDGRRRDMGLGGYPAVPLKDARVAARKAREMARAGTDPIERRVADAAERRRARQAQERAMREAEARTFRAVALACIDAHAPGWKSERTSALWRSSLALHVFPIIGDVPVSEVDRAAVLRAIHAVWTTRPGVARKLLQRIGTVLRYAAAHGMRANDDVADVRLLRHAGLPALPGSRKHPSLPWQKVPHFMRAVATMSGLAPLALRFLVLTALRSGEVRGARWSEISVEGGAVWTVPGTRMKRKKAAAVLPHRVPLSDAAIDVLVQAYRLTSGTSATCQDLPRLIPLMGDALIFPSARLTTPLSDMSLSAVMRRMNGDDLGEPPLWRDSDGRSAVPHGFRSSFRTWVDDTRPADAPAAERALAHEEPSRVVASYRRSDLFDRRVPLMADWAEHCSCTAVPGRKAATGR